MGTATIKHPVPDGVKLLSFVIFDIRALWRSVLSVRVPGCQKLQMTAVGVRILCFVKMNVVAMMHLLVCFF